MNKPCWPAGLSSLLVLFWSGAVMAHEGSLDAAGFVSGLSHPVSGLDHVLAMVAVGLWGAQLGAPAVIILPILFPLVMAFGGLLGLVGSPLPGVEIGIALSALVLGVMVMGSVRPPVWPCALVVALFAVFHGHAHGTELPAGTEAIHYTIGFVLGTALLHASGIVLGLLHRGSAGRRAVRIAGACVAAGGIFFLWQAAA